MLKPAFGNVSGARNSMDSYSLHCRLHIAVCQQQIDAHPNARQAYRPFPTLAQQLVSKKNRVADTPDFEKSLAELEQIVERMEQGELSLDESLKQFERGIALTRSCQTALQQAEQKVEILLRKSGAPDGLEAQPFTGADDADE